MNVTIHIHVYTLIINELLLTHWASLAYKPAWGSYSAQVAISGLPVNITHKLSNNYYGTYNVRYRGADYR